MYDYLQLLLKALYTLDPDAWVYTHIDKRIEITYKHHPLGVRLLSTKVKKRLYCSSLSLAAIRILAMARVYDDRTLLTFSLDSLTVSGRTAGLFIELDPQEDKRPIIELITELYEKRKEWEGR